MQSRTTHTGTCDEQDREQDWVPLLGPTAVAVAAVSTRDKDRDRDRDQAQEVTEARGHLATLGRWGVGAAEVGATSAGRNKGSPSVVDLTLATWAWGLLDFLGWGREAGRCPEQRLIC